MSRVSSTVAAMLLERPDPRDASPGLTQARLWIDGVGTWLLWFPERLTIGGPVVSGSSGHTADLPLLADLSRQHAALERSGEHYRLSLFGAGGVGKVTLAGETFLQSGDEIRLGEDVRLKFELPSALSVSARVTIPSGHRPAERIDGVVLMEQTCLIGPQPDQHIVCPRADHGCVLFRKGGTLWCRSREEWSLQGRSLTGAAELAHGAVVATPTLSFRLELTS